VEARRDQDVGHVLVVPMTETDGVARVTLE
jgi:hypothetical protein